MKNGNTKSLELLRYARRYDGAASQELLMRFRDPLLKRIRLMMGDKVRRKAESQDFLQQVMVDFLKASHSFEIRSDKDILRWLTAVARNNIRDAGRRRRVQAFESLSSCFTAGEVVVDAPSPFTQVVMHEDTVRLLEGLEKLKDDYRKVIDLHHLEGLSLKSVAARMGRSHDAVKKLHTRAMIRLGSHITSSVQ